MSQLYKASQKEIAVLCEMYTDYMSLSQSIQTAERSIAQLFAQGEEPESTSILHIKKFVQDVQSLQQQLSDAMTFGNPFVWIGYKRIAYQGTPKEMKTVGDLIEHCTPKGYICTKRYACLNEWFVNVHNQPIEDLFTHDQLLIELEQSTSLREIVSNKDFLRQWELHEYFRENDTIAKWKNY